MPVRESTGRAAWVLVCPALIVLEHWIGERPNSHRRGRASPARQFSARGPTSARQSHRGVSIQELSWRRTHRSRQYVAERTWTIPNRTAQHCGLEFASETTDHALSSCPTTHAQLADIGTFGRFEHCLDQERRSAWEISFLISVLAQASACVRES